jgi:hypothetical protein
MLWCVRVGRRGAIVFLSWARLVVGDCWLAKKFISRSSAERADWWAEPSRLG